MPDTVVAASLTLDPKQANQSFASFKAELKLAQQEVINLTAKFGATSEAARDAAKRAAELKDRIGDAKKLTDSFNPDEKFRGFTQVLTGVAGGFSAITGAMGLLGIQSEDVQKQLLKVQSAMAITQGLNSIGDSIQSFKNLGATLVQTLGKGGLIGIAIAGVGLLVAAMSGLFDSTKKQTEAQKALNDVNKEAQKEAVKQRTELDLLVHSAQDVNLSVKERLDKVTELQAAFPGYFEDIKTEKDLNEKLAGAYDKATQGILAKAHATAVFNKIVENENKALQIQTDLEKEQAALDKENDNVRKARDAESRGLAQFQISFRENNIKAYKRELAALDEVNKALEKSAQTQGPTTDDAARAEAARKKREAEATKSNKEFLSTHTLVGGVWFTNEELKQASEDAKIRTQVAAGQITGKVTAERIKSPEELALEEEIKAKHDLRIQDEADKKRNLVYNKGISDDNIRLSQEQVDAEEAATTAKIGFAQAIQGVLTGVSALFGRQTAASKIAALADIAIGTGVGFINALKIAQQTAAATGPAAAFAFPIFYATQIAAVLAAAARAKSILGSGGGGGGTASVAAPSLSIPQAPLAPQAQVSTTRLDQGTINNTNNATVQAYVIESQGADATERRVRLNRAARLGG